MRGIKRGNLQIAIGHYEGRKKPCLFIVGENFKEKVAVFSGEEAASEFLEALKELIGKERVKK